MESATPKARIGHARDVARAWLKKHGVTAPPTPVEALVKAEGLEIRRRPWGRDGTVSGLLLRERGLIVLNGDQPPQRQRFSLAHELGHFALHHHLLKGQLQSIDIDHPPDGLDAHGDKVLEREADIFASELLIPREFLLRFRERPSKAPANDGGAPFNSPFAGLKKQLGSEDKALSPDQLAALFDVSRAALFVALEQHGLL